MALAPPPMPSWDSLHPLVVHFPIALLLVAPIFVLLGLILHRRSKAYSVSALVLMALGTVGAWVAVATGTAAMQLAITDTQSAAVLEDHQELAHLVRMTFTILVAVYAVILLAPALLRKELKATAIVAVHGAFLVAYAFGMLQVANVGHLGGRLVHEFGIRALL